MVKKIYSAKYVNLIIKFRFLIALVIFLTAVSLQLHGSSINMWDSIVTTKIDNSEKSLIMGKVRPVRGDEWCVQTPYYLAQAMSDEFYPLHNENIRSDGENMIIAYNSPVWDITVLSKPFNWGFLLLGKDYGLSWYWAMKTILLFLLSFEVSMILTKRKKGISLLGALWITYSPAVQWWFMQHVGDLVFYFQAMVVSFYYIMYYFKNIKLKIIFSLMFALSSIGFVLVVYPAIQVPLAYLCLVFMVLIFTDFKDKIKIKLADIGIILGTLLVIGVNLGHFIMVSKDDLKLIFNTVYPGKRISLGGEVNPNFMNLFLTNVFIPYKDTNFINNCEISSFFNFLPAVLVTLVLAIKRKAADLKYGIALTACILAEMAWMFIKFPTAFAKLTLFSYVPGNRIVITFGITAVYLSIWVFSLLCDFKPFKKIQSLVISIVILASYYYSIIYFNLIPNISLKFTILLLIMFFVLNFLFLTGRKIAFSILMSLLIIFSGATVNPLVKGTGAIYNKVLSKEIQTIKSEDKNALWAVFGDDMGSYLYANGVKTFNGIHFYPDLKSWELIDHEKKYINVYNRYAHILLELSETTSFQLLSPDLFRAHLTVNDLKILNIKYILTKTDLNAKDGIFKEVYGKDKDGFYIFEINDKE